jgi:hypothetical protein
LHILLYSDDIPKMWQHQLSQCAEAGPEKMDECLIDDTNLVPIAQGCGWGGYLRVELSELGDVIVDISSALVVVLAMERACHTPRSVPRFGIPNLHRLPPRY